MSRGGGRGKAALPPSVAASRAFGQNTAENKQAAPHGPVSPPPLFPPDHPLPPAYDPTTVFEQRCLALWEELDGYWRHENPHTVHHPTASFQNKRVERYSDRYVKRVELPPRLALETDATRFPDELLPVITTATAMASKRMQQKKKMSTISDTLAKLAALEAQDQDEEGDETLEMEDDEDEEAAEPEEEDYEDDNDYAQSYFDNGEDYGGDDYGGGGGGGGDEDGPVY